jgi:hypothetical protein
LKIRFRPKLFGENLNATTISPFVSYLIVKQEEQIPVTFALDGSYERQIYSNTVLSDNDIDMNGNFFTIGASLYSMFEVSEAMKIQPGIGFNFFTGKLNSKILQGQIPKVITTTVFFWDCH